MDASHFADDMVRRHIEGTFPNGQPFYPADHPCRRYCLNGTLCSYHDGMWDGASEAHGILTQPPGPTA